MSTLERRVRDRLLAEHGDVLEGVLAAADAVASEWPPAGATDRAAVVGPLSAELEDRGLVERFPALVETAASAAGEELAARPVPAPPYVAITSRGPVLRATVEDGRLVVAVGVFAIERGHPTRYVRTDGDPASVLSVAFRSR